MAALRVPTLTTDALEREEEGWDAPFVMIGGAIKHWWYDNWETPAHWAYVVWRNALAQGCIDAGYLVYRPDTAMKGTWNPIAQAINDKAIEVCHLFVVVSEWDVPSYGTDAEIAHAIEVGTKWRRLPSSMGFDNAMEEIARCLAIVRD
jgi:hypothetical protein